MSHPKSDQRLYLGLELSTQQLTGIVIDEQLNSIAEEAIHFNDETSNGLLVDKNDTSVLVFLEALDALFQKLRDQKKFNFENLLGISGCAQQHGSVFWKNQVGLESLRTFHSIVKETNNVSDIHHLPKNLFLVDLLRSSFSSLECQCLEKTDGEPKAYDRFIASQIIRISREAPEIYQQTERIQLLSNFLASVLLGFYAPIDLSDGSRMNLLDIRQRQWSKECLNVGGTDLEGKLSNELVYPITALGTIAKYFTERYGSNPNCQIISFIDDNPSSYYALAADPKTVVISLGTSDTVMASISAASIPSEVFDGHLFVNPLADNLLMLLLCFENGSLVRERVREEVASKDWQQMSELLCHTPPSNHGFLGYFFDDQEILPGNIQGRFYFNADEQLVEDLEPACKARALLEGQCLAKRLYLQRNNIDLVHQVDRIVITGGASVNIDFLQILADIFAKPVYAALAPHSGCLGGALRAIDVVNHPSSSTDKSTVQCLVAAQPRNEYTSVYDEMLTRYAKFEEKILYSQ